jgi:uncharacterized protein YgiM (DUF1202 family)
MALQDKYQSLINIATLNGVSNLAVRESEGVLYIDGVAPNGSVKQQLWDEYEKIDPTFTGGDLVLNIDAAAGLVEGAKVKVTTNKSNLNIRKGPGTDQDIIGKAGRGEVVTFISKADDQWWLIRNEAGIEGYCFTQYLTPEN